MNKTEAAQYLGVSTRAIERYCKKGWLSVTYLGSKTRPIADYDENELRGLKEELNATVTKPAFAPLDQEDEKVYLDSFAEVSDDDRRDPIPPEMETLSLSVGDRDRRHMDLEDDGHPTTHDLVNYLAIAFHKFVEESKGQARVSEKLLLSATEVRQLTGLGANFLKECIKNGTLASVTVGRSRKVKRSELERWVGEL